MPYAVNPTDGTHIYYEDTGGDGVPVVLYGGILDSVPLLRETAIARSLDPREFRPVLVDHRGVGRSDTPRDPVAYRMPRRASDAVAVLDDLDIERAGFVGTSYGGRLCFGVAEQAPDRVASLVAGGQHPYRLDPAGPLGRVISDSLAESRSRGSLEPFVAALEEAAGTAFPSDQREVMLTNDAVAVDAASTTMVAEGRVATGLDGWTFPCLLFVGSEDDDVLDGARRAATEIPRAELIVLPDSDHLATHAANDVVVPAVHRTLRTGA